MRRRILPRILAIGVLVLALAGCVRFQADLELKPENTVSGNIVVAVILADETEEARESTLAGVQQIAAGLLGNLAQEPGVTTSEYDQDGYLGERLEFQNVPLTAFSGTEPGALHFERVGDEFVFSGAIDFTDQSAPADDAEAEDQGNLTVKVTFPGTVTEHDGTLSGTTVSWSTPIERALQMNARGSATAAGAPLGLIIGIVVAVLVLAALVVGFLVLRSRRKPAVPAATAGADAATALPAAPAPVAPAGAPPIPVPSVTTPEVTAPPVTPPAAAPPVAAPPVAPEVPGAPTPPAVVEPETPPAPPKKPRAPRAPKAPGTETPPA